MTQTACVLYLLGTFCAGMAAVLFGTPPTARMAWPLLIILLLQIAIAVTVVVQWPR